MIQDWTRRKAVVATSALIAAIAFAGCGDDPEAGDDEGSKTAFGAKQDSAAIELLPQEIEDAGELSIATNGDYPPYAFYGEDQKTLEGVAVDMGKALSAVLGLEAKFEVTSFDNFIPGVTSEKYDVALSGTYDTPERAETVDLVDYLQDGGLVLVKKGNPKGASPEQLCGLKVAVVAGTTFANGGMQTMSDACTSDGESEIDISVFPAASNAALALSSDRVDAYVNPAISLYYLMTQNDEFEAAGDPFNPIPAAIVVAKGSDLSMALAQGIEALIDQGVYAKILDKWGLGDAAIDCVTMNSQAECVLK